MDNDEARRLLDAHLGTYRQLGYNVAVARIGQWTSEVVVGASGVQYQIEVGVVWDAEPGGAVRVLGAIDDGGWRAFRPLSMDLLLERTTGAPTSNNE